MVEKLYTEPARGAAPPRADLAVLAVRRVQEALPRHRSRAGLLEGSDRAAAADRVLRVARHRRRVLRLLLPRRAATWDYYFSGAWTYERGAARPALGPGFTFAPQIPRIVAAPLTLIVFGARELRCVRGRSRSVVLARADAGRCPRTPTSRRRPALAARVRHGMLAFCGLVAFNAFYCFAGQPTLQRAAAAGSSPAGG